MPRVTAGRVGIHYDVVGRGPTLVLPTGAGGDSRIRRDAGYVRGLSGFRRVFIDHRGRGRSDRPSRIEDPVMTRYVEDVALVLEAAGVESAGFWG
jgi:aminoacrylate hydrolase